MQILGSFDPGLHAAEQQKAIDCCERLSPVLLFNEHSRLNKRHRPMTTLDRIRSIAAVSISTLSLLMAAASQSYADEATEDPDVLAATRLFSAWMENQMSYKGIPGVVVGVVSGDELIWTQAYGFADLSAERRMTSDARFRMASHSKLFTATAIMQLREQGKLRLDDPVSEYLPWFKIKQTAADDPPITIEHLLTHSSGLPREARAHWTELDFPTQQELVDLTPERVAAFPPETRWKYSNYAYTLAGLVIESLSGESWADYLQANIFSPLGMDASSVDQDDPMLATGYGRRMPDGSREVMPFVDARAMASATGLTSSVEDMARFVSAQFREGARGDGRILSTASLREMHRVRVLENDWSFGWGIGFSVRRVGDAVHIGHGGGYPGYTTNTRIELANEVGVIVLTNTIDSSPAQISEQLMETVGKAVAKTKSKEEEVAWDPAWARFAGVYRSGWSDTSVVLMNEKLVLLDSRAEVPESKRYLKPIGKDRFLMSAPNGGGPVGEVVRFIEKDGKVLRMITGDEYANRVSR